MLGKMITIALLLGLAYWYWSGPYQARVNPNYEQRLEENAEKMRVCIRSENYRAGATGVGTGSPEENCARKYNLYREDGRWYSYDDVRKQP